MKTIDRYVAAKEKVQSTIDEYRLVHLSVSDIQKNKDTFIVNGNKFTEQSIEGLLSLLGVKKSLVDDIKDDAEQWEPLHEALACIKEDIKVTAVINTKCKEVSQIVSYREENDGFIDLSKSLQYTENFLKTHTEDLTLSSMYFNPVDLSVHTDFRSPSFSIDVFGDGKDIWEGGFGTTAGLNKFQTYPFYIRLICANGMKAVHQMTQRFVNSKDLTQRTFNRQIAPYASGAEGTKDVIKNGKRLLESAASLREYFIAQKLAKGFDNALDQGGIFDDTSIVNAYAGAGVNLASKNARWKSSATSNVNSYDLFNALTFVASHKLGEKDSRARLEINRFASELFFKGPELREVPPNPFMK